MPFSFPFTASGLLPLHAFNLLLVYGVDWAGEHPCPRTRHLHRQPHEPVRGRSSHCHHLAAQSRLPRGREEHAEAHHRGLLACAGVDWGGAAAGLRQEGRGENHVR